MCAALLTGARQIAHDIGNWGGGNEFFKNH